MKEKNASVTYDEEVAILLYIIQNIMIPSAILPAHVAVALDRFRTVDGACDLSLLALTADYATYGRTDSLPGLLENFS